jgi:hypothetical protein
VTVTDELIARHDATNLLNALRLITVPGSSGGAASVAAAQPSLIPSAEPVLLGIDRGTSPWIAPAFGAAVASERNPREEAVPAPTRAETAASSVFAAYDLVLKGGFPRKLGNSRHAASLPGLSRVPAPLFAETPDTEEDDSAVDEALADDWLYDWPSL